MSTSWQTVSVFISSTFNDMHAERDYLVKRVFPELREWCEKRKLRLVDIDLRWGVTEEDATKHKNVVKVCLDRIDECRPFFLCFLGQRRGWVPGEGDVSKETCETFKDLKGQLGNASVTELEILHAAINPLNAKDRAQYSFFYLRDDSYLTDLPEDPHLIRKTFTNESIQDPTEREVAGRELKIWRDEKIPSTGRPVHHYSVTWNAKASTPELRIPLKCPSSNPENQKQWRSLWKDEAGIIVPENDREIPPVLVEKAEQFNQRLTCGRLEEFTSQNKPMSEIVLEDLKKAIEERYPDNKEIPAESDLQKELDQQEQFLHLNNEGFIERSGDFDQLDAYADGDSRNLFVLTAPGGMGKTILLANWIDHYRKTTYGKDVSLFYRFIGASDLSTTIDSVIRYLLREMNENARLFNEEIPDDPEKIRTKWLDILIMIGRQQKTIIIIDAINQLESGLLDLRWIPRQMPLGIKLIVSFKRGNDNAEDLIKQFAKSKNITLSEVKSFENEKDQKELISAYLRQYLKELDQSCIREIISIEGAKNPLFLKIVLFELRIFGIFSNIGEKIRCDFGTTPVSAFDAVLQRLENDPIYSPIEPKIGISLIFGLLSHARHGLSEEELFGLFIQELRLENTPSNNKDIRDTIRLFIRQVRPFLATRGGRQDFFYESFRIACLKRYAGLNHDLNRRLSSEWHDSLAMYFEQLPSWSSFEENIPTFRRAAELPYHLVMAGKSDHLIELLLTYELLETIVFGVGPDAAIEDISLCLKHPVLGQRKENLSEAEGLIFVQKALRLSTHVLRKYPKQLPSQLVGRLLGLKNPTIREFVERINRFERYPWLRPINHSLNPPGGHLLHTFAGHTRRVCAVTLTPDGRLAISGSDDNTLKVWDLESGNELMTLTGHTGSIDAVAVTPDGQRVISGSQDKTLKVWDLESGNEIVTLSAPLSPHISSKMIALTPDSGRVVVSYNIAVIPESRWVDTEALYRCHRIDNRVYFDNRFLKVWDLNSGNELITLTCHFGSVDAVTITPDGRLAISGSDDKTLKVWDLESGNELMTLTGHTGSVDAVIVTPDGRRVISGSQDKTLKVWDLESGNELMTLIGHTGSVDAVIVTPDGHQVISFSSDCSLKIWDLKTGRNLVTFGGQYVRIRANTITLTPDGHRVICGSDDNTLNVWDLESGNELMTLTGHSDKVNTVAVTPNGRQVISGSDDNTLNVWDLETYQEPETLTGHSDKVNTVAVTPDERLAISGSGDKTLKIWDLESGRELVTLNGHSGSVDAVAVTPDGRRVISNSWGNPLKVWDLESGKELITLNGHSGWVNAVAVTPDGHRVIFGYMGANLKIWDLETGKLLNTLKGHSGRINAVAVTSDGRQVISGSDDNTLKIWDLETGRQLGTFTRNEYNFNAIAVTHDGVLAFSPTNDGCIKVWDLKMRREQITLTGHSSLVRTVAVTPNGLRAISGSNDKTLKVWDLKSGLIIAEFYSDSLIISCGYSELLKTVIAGGIDGNIFILQLQEVPQYSPNAMEIESRQKSSLKLFHFYCLQGTNFPVIFYQVLYKLFMNAGYREELLNDFYINVKGVVLGPFNLLCKIIRMAVFRITLYRKRKSSLQIPR
jgi:WD40 repeat protein